MSGNVLDLYARQVLMSAYLYYKRDMPVLSDAENDLLCEKVSFAWRDVPTRYKPLLDPEMTDGESILDTTHHCLFTRQVEGGALKWLERLFGKRLPRLTEGHFLLTEELIEEHEMFN